MGKIKTAASISDLVERLKAKTGLTEAQGACRDIMVRILLGETRVQIGIKKSVFRVARKLLAKPDPLHALCNLRDHRRRQRSLGEIRSGIINLADRNHTAREIQKTIGCRMELVTDTLKAAGKETLASTERGDALADSEPALDLMMIYVSSDLQLVLLTGNKLRQRPRNYFSVNFQVAGVFKRLVVGMAGSC